MDSSATNFQKLRTARDAHRRAVSYHLFDPDVTLIDIGWKIIETQHKLITDELSIRVHRRHKPRGEQFKAFARRYPDRVISEDNIGFPVDIVEASYPYHEFDSNLNERTNYYNPLRGGISISNEFGMGCGTLGGFVMDAQSKTPMILSNWHVLDGCSFAEPGLDIYQPGYGDGGWYRDAVAYLTRHAMAQGIDAAVAELNGNRRYINQQLDIGPVTGVTEPQMNQRVVKSGRSSGITRGIVTGYNGVSKIMYGGFERLIQHIIHIAETRPGTDVSSPGDSGSWWLDEDTHEAVALHFAGCNQPEYGLAISMPEVLKALKVKIIC